jgi:hypothetical protein
MYDFGDGWEHDVVIEEVAKCKTQAATTRCALPARGHVRRRTAAESGDTRIFWRSSAIRRTRSTHAMLEWIGGAFDPEAFDLAEVNSNLKNYKLYDLESAE